MTAWVAPGNAVGCIAYTKGCHAPMGNDGGWVIRLLVRVLKAESLDCSRFKISLGWGCGYFSKGVRVFLGIGTCFDVLKLYPFITNRFKLFFKGILQPEKMYSKPLDCMFPHKMIVKTVAYLSKNCLLL